VVTWVQEWVRFLQQSGALFGFPLALGGLILMFGGWRLWKFAVVLSFATIGALVGAFLAGGSANTPWYALGGFLLLGVASYPPINYSIVALGGVIGATIVNYIFAGLNLPPNALWLITGIGLIVSCALAFLNLRQVIVVVTSFEGALLLLSAAVSFLSEVPGLFGYFRAMVYEGSIFLPFLVLVPTVVGTLIQLADVNRRQVSVAH